MVALNITDVKVVSFPVDTTVTAPTGGTYVAIANLRYGLPDGGTSLTVTPAGKAYCQLRGVYTSPESNIMQVFTVDEVRTSA